MSGLERGMQHCVRASWLSWSLTSKRMESGSVIGVRETVRYSGVAGEGRGMGRERKDTEVAQRAGSDGTLTDKHRKRWTRSSGQRTKAIPWVRQCSR